MQPLMGARGKTSLSNSVVVPMKNFYSAKTYGTTVYILFGI